MKAKRTKTIEELCSDVASLTAIGKEFAADADALEAKLKMLYGRTPEIVSETQQRRANLERLMTLAGMGDNPLWQTVLSYADEHARNEQQIALGPNLSDADRQYNAGRAGGALDFAMALRDLRMKAEAEAEKGKRASA